ncbi:TolC family protein [Simkania sp.]|uniref:TolC family protein n=1 Tax=Simkania sp. TaxID=34094 RepID=UPI003B53044D
MKNASRQAFLTSHRPSPNDGNSKQLHRTEKANLRQTSRHRLQLGLFSDPEVNFPIQEDEHVAFYESAFTVPEEIDLFAQLFQAKKLAFVGDASLIGDPHFLIIQKKIFTEMEKRGIQPLLIPLTDSPHLAAEKLSTHPVDGVVFLPTWRLSPQDFSTLIETCNELELPTFSVFGETEVEQGILMSQMPKSEVVRAARRVALNVQELFRTGNNEELSPHFRHSLTPVINTQTAKDFAFVIPTHLQRDALLLAYRYQPFTSLSLIEATKRAVNSNLELLAEDFTVKSGTQDVVRSFSKLLPQVFFHLEGRKVDPNQARNTFGLEPENLIRSTFLVHQTLYDDKKIADFVVQKRTQKAREYHFDSFELDIILSTAIAYLTLLRVDADLEIAKENISLSRAHLNRSKELVDSGMARLSEVYRWESELAANQDQLVNLIAVKENLGTEFNRLLNRPLDTPISLEELPPSFYENLSDQLQQTPLLKHFKRLMIDEARENSPELKGIDEMLVALERKLTAAKRSFYLPEFAAFGEFSNNLYQEGAGNMPPPGISNKKLYSKVGVSLTYPLFTSGSRMSEKNQASFEIQKTKTLRASLLEKIDEAVIQTIDNMKASFESIHLAEKAYVTAQKNLKLVTKSYAHGEVSVVDLLDAQHQMIVSKQQHAHTFYDYLIDVMKFERALSQFTFFPEPA